LENIQDLISDARLQNFFNDFLEKYSLQKNNFIFVLEGWMIGCNDKNVMKDDFQFS